MLVSNSQNTILLEALAPPLAQAMGQPVSAQQYTNDIAESVHGSKPDPVDAGPLSAHTAIASSLTQSTLMISIHSKNDTAKNNSEYSLDAIKAMRLQITTLVRPILAIVQVERPDSYIDMKNLLNPPNGMQKISKWNLPESLVKIWDLFRETPSLVDGSFVGHFTRQTIKQNHDLDTYISVMTNIKQLVDEELGQKIDSVRSIKSIPFPVGEKERNYMSPGLPMNRVKFPHCASCLGR
jgi:hypothetical protein